uniref:SH3 domain binding kinase family member 2 n=1 Tax=Latimeria chalumnae TaxID=7897 RepID=H3AVC5_LATCH
AMNLNADKEASEVVEELLELTSQNLAKMEVKDHYNIIQELGQGKYGRVLMVTHRIRGTPMALKLVPKQTSKLWNFLYEYCVSLYLSSHPNMVNMFGIVFESQEHYGFLQELALDRDLLALIQPRIGIPEDAVKRCARQISNALGFLHCKGLVHRDIKPENILVFDKDCRWVKLTDFGLTRRKGTILRLISGFLPYTAPELGHFCNSEGLPIDFNLDSWAFGVTLFCIQTGYFPWEKCLPGDFFYEEFARWVKSGEAKEPCTIPRHWRRFTPEALSMFQKLLAVDPKKRGTVEEVLNYMDFQWKVDNWKEKEDDDEEEEEDSECLSELEES